MTTFIISTIAVMVIAAALMLGGCASATPTNQVALGAASEGYTCPLTGEALPCPKCCPLNKN